MLTCPQNITFMEEINRANFLSNEVYFSELPGLDVKFNIVRDFIQIEFD